MHKSKKALSLYSKWGRYWEYGVMVISYQSKKTFEQNFEFHETQPLKITKNKTKVKGKKSQFIGNKMFPERTMLYIDCYILLLIKQ